MQRLTPLIYSCIFNVCVYSSNRKRCVKLHPSGRRGLLTYIFICTPCTLDSLGLRVITSGKCRKLISGAIQCTAVRSDRSDGQRLFPFNLLQTGGRLSSLTSESNFMSSFMTSCSRNFFSFLFREAILEAGRCVFGIQTQRQRSCCGSGDTGPKHLCSVNTKEKEK